MIDRENEASIALLIDADNASPDHLDEVLLVLGELGRINIRRAYGNWEKTSLKGWSALSSTHSVVQMVRRGIVGIDQQGDVGVALGPVCHAANPFMSSRCTE